MRSRSSGGRLRREAIPQVGRSDGRLSFISELSSLTWVHVSRTRRLLNFVVKQGHLSLPKGRLDIFASTQGRLDGKSIHLAYRIMVEDQDTKPDEPSWILCKLHELSRTESLSIGLASMLSRRSNRLLLQFVPYSVSVDVVKSLISAPLKISSLARRTPPLQSSAVLRSPS